MLNVCEGVAIMHLRVGAKYDAHIVLSYYNTANFVCLRTLQKLVDD